MKSRYFYKAKVNVRRRSTGIIVQNYRKKSYESIKEMWEGELKKPTAQIVDPIGSLNDWYTRANRYWKV